MDEPSGNSSQATLGNVAIPEWMLKRRARMQALAAQNDNPPDHPVSVTAEIVIPCTVTTETIDRGMKDDEQLILGRVENKGIETPAATVAPEIDQPLAATTAPVDLDQETTRDEAEVAQEPQGQPPEPVPFPSIVVSPRTISAKSTARPVKKAGPAPVIEATEAPLPGWHETLRRRWLGKDALRSYAISIIMHLIVALPLSLVVFHEEIANMGLSTLLATQGEESHAESIDDSPVFQVDASGGQTGQLDTMLSANAVSTALGPSELAVSEELGGLNLGEGDGAGDQIGNGLNVGGFRMPEGGKAVQKGSFTAWTVPEDPQPGEDYKIIIQVRYKNKNQRISPDDISGSVIGTDKYRLMISRHTTEIIREANQVVVYIPGAAARVRDTIRVYSAMLRENQRLEIVF